jgi:hypothetical protein
LSFNAYYTSVLQEEVSEGLQWRQYRRRHMLFHFRGLISKKIEAMEGEVEPADENLMVERYTEVVCSWDTVLIESEVRWLLSATRYPVVGYPWVIIMEDCDLFDQPAVAYKLRTGHL